MQLYIYRWWHYSGVTDKGGTTLESLLSDKNLRKGEECDRLFRRTSAQRDKKKEPCTMHNIVYESKCGKCNPPGYRKEQDSLEDKRADLKNIFRCLRT